MKYNHFFSTLGSMVIILMIISCSSTKKNTMSPGENNQNSVGVPSPPVIIYKTKVDYSDKVPVTLSDDKTKITSFPATSDIKINNKYTFPTKLENGFLLDNRGIGKNSVFLRFSYDDYYTMDNIPNAERLMNYIIDKDPFTEMYECGKKGDYTSLEEGLNKLIKEGGLKKCKKLIGKK
nr:hypothetical protein [Bacteroidota bacterium]